MNHILLVEDDSRIREVVERGLGARGFIVTAAEDGEAAIELAATFDFDLVLLDLVLPNKQGLEVLEDIRSFRPRLPAIALTAIDDVGSKVGGLNAGVDDYITKPFSIEELSARVRARLRWNEEDNEVLKAGPLTVDLAAHRAILHGKEIHLSAREIRLLATFIHHLGQVQSRAELLENVWDLNFDPGSNVLDVYVAALRRKIGSEFIETIRGLGYRFIVPHSQEGIQQASG